MPESQDPSRADAAEASQWTWNFRSERLSALARYVSEPALEGTQLRLRDTPDLRRAAKTPSDGDRIVARAVYERLLALGLSSAWEEWAPRWTVQRVRHPSQIVYDGHADCLDLALLYASLCQSAHVAPLLAVVKKHAFVLLVPGRFHDVRPDDSGEETWPPFQLEGASCDGDPGVQRVEDLTPLLDRIDRGELLPVDAYGVAQRSSLDEAGREAQRSSFDEAVEAGREALLQPNLRLIDVPWLHARPGTEAVRAPARVVEMSPYVPGGDDLFIEYESRRRVVDELRARSGLVVLIGRSGTGKSVLARHLVATARFGAGWFLNASTPQSLLEGLARADLARREREPSGVDGRDREEQAMAALVRLRLAPHPWVVVLDNADGDPGPLMRLLPSAGEQRQQLVVVTTTNRAWREQPDVQVVELEPLPEQDVREQLRRDDLIALAEGRPLLIDAFAKLMRVISEQELDRALAASATLERPPAASGARPTEPELRGPRVVWRAIRARSGFGEQQLRLAASIAMLPADHQPATVLESLHPDAAGMLADLARAGLIALDHSGETVKMHRLFGRVVRDDLAESEPLVQRSQALALARSEQAIALLSSHGDLETTKRLAGALQAAEESSENADGDLGRPLHAVGQLLELQGDSLASAAVYERAQRHLTDACLLADCLQGRARAVNQHRSDEQELVIEAIGWAREAQALIERQSEPARAGRCVAMQGLLLQKLADLDSHRGEREQLLDQARALVEDAHERRLSHLPPDDPELLRSRFNFGGIEINLARAHPERAAEHLQRAEQTYREVAERRREVYGVDIHPHIAACHAGLALVGYYRATLLPAGEVQRSLWLRDATYSAQTAIGQREAIDGAADGAEIRKVAARLAKAAVARHVRPGFERQDAEKLFAEIRSELPASPSSQS